MGSQHNDHQQPVTRQRLRHLLDRRRSAGPSPRIRRDAAHRTRGVGRTGRSRRGSAGAAPGRRARRHADRHRRFLRAVRQRFADPRGAAPLPRGPGDRDQGRLHPAGPRRLDRRRPSGVPAAAGGTEPAAPGRGAHRPAAAAPDRPGRPAGRPDRRACGAAVGGQDPAHRAVRGVRRADQGGAGDSRRSPRCRTCTTWPTARPRTCWTTRRRRTSRSSRGSRWPPDSWPVRAARWTTWPARTTRRRPNSRWPGCCTARPSMLPIPGTSSVAHLEDNLEAAKIQLNAEEFETLSAATG